ncbi:MAG: BON domain-containing protein [Planctomycetota bacterium]
MTTVAHKIVGLCSFVACCCLVATPAAAQLSNAGGGGGGAGLFGGGQSLFGSSINAGFGANAGGVGQLGQGGQLGGFGSNQFSFSQQTGQDGNFVGRTGGDTGAVFEALNRGSNEFLNRFERTLNSRNRGRGQNQAVDARPPIRVNLRLGFRAPATPSRNLAAPTAERLNLLLADKGFGASASVAGGVAVLTGQVEDDGQRRMLEQLARLEPGISRVENRLNIAGGLIEQPAPGGPIPLAPGS